MEQAGGGSATGGFRVEAGGAAGVTTVVATGGDPQGTLVAGLRGVLAQATGGGGGGEGGDATLAAPIEAQGADLGETFAGLVESLLAQVDVLGGGLTDIRLDGLLETDDGGYSAWGYAVGREQEGPLPRAVELAGPVAVSVPPDGGVELRAALRPLAP